MQKVEAAVKVCSDMYSRGSVVTVESSIDADGSMLWAETTGEWAGTWTGYCAAKAVCGAVFPVSKMSFPLTYPFKL